MYLGSREMKPAFERSNANRPIRRRPFRALAVAATILVASALVAGCHKEKPGHQAEAEAAPQQTAQPSVYSEEDARINRLRWESREQARSACINGEYSSYGDLPMELKGKITHAKRRLLISGIVEKFIARRHEAALANRTEDMAQAAYGNGTKPFTRKEDSLFIRKGMMEEDSAGLAETMHECLDRPELRLAVPGWRGSPVSTILNSFRPMLPEARNRRQDSLFLQPIMAAHAVVNNLRLVGELFYNSKSDDKGSRMYGKNIRQALRAYEKMKLPDGCTRKKDSLIIFTMFGSLEDRQNTEYEAQGSGGRHYCTSTHAQPGRDWYGNGIEFSGGSGRR